MKSIIRNPFSKKQITASLMVVFAIGLSACSQTTDQTTAPVEAQTNSVEAYGVVRSLNQLDVVLDFPASLEKLHVREGQKLGKNEPIANLNLENFNLQIQSKEIEMKIFTKEKARILSESTIGLGNDPSYQKLLDGQVLAKSNLDQAKKDFENAAALIKTGAISQSEYDQYKLNYEAKGNTLSSIEQDIAKYTKSKEGVSSSVGIKDLQATATNLTLGNMKNKLSNDVILNGQIISPFENSVVYDIGYAEGDLINASQKVCSLADLNALIIDADVTEDFISEIKVGAAVEIVPVSDRTKTYKGKVIRIADMAKIKNGETIISVEISIENNDGSLKPNYNVDLSIAK